MALSVHPIGDSFGSHFTSTSKGVHFTGPKVPPFKPHRVHWTGLEAKVIEADLELPKNKLW